MIKQIILLIIGGVITYFGQLIFNNYQTEVKNIDYKITIDKNFISTPNIPKDNIKILVDGKEQKEITKIQVEIFNFSNKDFDKVPIFIILKLDNGKNLNIIKTYEEGFKNIPSSVSKILDKKLLPRNTPNVFEYDVKPLKRTENFEAGLKVIYLIQGKLEPKIDVFTSLNDVKVIPFDYTHSPKSMKQNILAISIILAMLIVLFLIIVFIIGPILSRFTYPLDKKPRIEYAKELSNELSKIEELSNLNKDDSYKIIKKILYMQRKEKWNKKSKISKWINGFIEPKPDDYKE